MLDASALPSDRCHTGVAVRNCGTPLMPPQSVNFRQLFYTRDPGQNSHERPVTIGVGDAFRDAQSLALAGKFETTKKRGSGPARRIEGVLAHWVYAGAVVPTSVGNVDCSGKKAQLAQWLAVSLFRPQFCVLLQRLLDLLN